VAIKQTIAVMSGKGGVGKSTVAVNLALALRGSGATVALIDGDFYGPSIPTLMGGGELQTNDQGQIIPPVRHGIKYMSIGFFLRHPDEAVIWRGPMLTKALTQLFTDVVWGDVDYAVIDMPPGTGDAHLSLAQMQIIQIAGALVVTTPQEVALADVRKSLSMLKKVNIDVLGIVENMAGFSLPDGTVIPIFGEGGGLKTAEQFDIPFFGSIPLIPSLREGGDKGEPAIMTDERVDGIFHTLSQKVIASLDAKLGAPQLEVVN
jgi:ATP-binding protein involved in chromosome partitioning